MTGGFILNLDVRYSLRWIILRKRPIQSGFTSFMLAKRCYRVWTRHPGAARDGRRIRRTYRDRLRRLRHVGTRRRAHRLRRRLADRGRSRLPYNISKSWNCFVLSRYPWGRGIGKFDAFISDQRQLMKVLFWNRTKIIYCISRANMSLHCLWAELNVLNK